MLDTTSLRLGLGVVALTMLALFYLVTYRTTRSSYVAWWCGALAFFVTGSSTYLLADVSGSAWTVPVGNTLVVSGAVCIWAGARSLRSGRSERYGGWSWSPAAAPLAVGILSAPVGLPGGDFVGHAAFLAAMWALIGLATANLWRQYRVSVVARDVPLAGSSYRLALRSLSLACGLVGVYYFVRWGALLALGDHSDLLAVYLGGSTTIMVSLVLLTTVSFSVSTLSNHQQSASLQRHASHDGTPAVLSRTEFLRRGEQQLLAMRRTGVEGQLVFADLDHFSESDHGQGSAARDRALATFAECCLTAVRTSDLVGRYGDELFVMLLAGASEDRATQITDSIDEAMGRAAATQRVVLPTVSYGIAELEESADFPRLLEYADQALCRAKEEGRNRSIHYLSGAC